MSKDAKERSWELVQIKAFTSWLNGYLKERGMELEDISSDLSDGVRLINFLELLSQKKITQKYDQKPPSRIQKIQNLHIALQFLQKEMQQQISISAEDFADKNLKMILGFLWSLFKKFRIQVIKHEDKSSEEGLLLWCKKTTEGYRGVGIENFKNSFRDGLAFLALCDKFLGGNKEKLDYDKYESANMVDNLNAAFDVAEIELGVPKLLDATEVSAGNVDERSLVLYVSLYFHAFVANQQKLKILAAKEQTESQLRTLSGTLEERARLAQELEIENNNIRQEMEDVKAQLLREAEEKEALKRQLEEQSDLIASLKAELEKQKKSAEELGESKFTLENQITGLEGDLKNWSSKFDNESQSRQKENDATNARNKVQVSGLGVLQKTLEEHMEDLHRWQKFLDLEKDTEVDFSGEIRPGILMDISKLEFDDQLQYLTKKLDKENEELISMLKSKEMEQKVKKEQESKKKERKNTSKI